jgi:hypothetical protein
MFAGNQSDVDEITRWEERRDFDELSRVAHCELA